jgi:hypothetical protein
MAHVDRGRACAGATLGPAAYVVDLPFPSDLDFDAGGGADGGAIHANTTEYETSRLALLNVCLIDVQGSVNEQCHSKV